MITYDPETEDVAALVKANWLAIFALMCLAWSVFLSFVVGALRLIVGTETSWLWPLVPFWLAAFAAVVYFVRTMWRTRRSYGKDAG